MVGSSGSARSPIGRSIKRRSSRAHGMKAQLLRREWDAADRAGDALRYRRAGRMHEAGRRRAEVDIIVRHRSSCIRNPGRRQEPGPSRSAARVSPCDRAASISATVGAGSAVRRAQRQRGSPGRRGAVALATRASRRPRDVLARRRRPRQCRQRQPDGTSSSARTALPHAGQNSTQAPVPGPQRLASRAMPNRMLPNRTQPKPPDGSSKCWTHHGPTLKSPEVGRR